MCGDTLPGLQLPPERLRLHELWGPTGLDKVVAPRRNGPHKFPNLDEAASLLWCSIVWQAPPHIFLRPSEWGLTRLSDLFEVYRFMCCCGPWMAALAALAVAFFFTTGATLENLIGDRPSPGTWS